MSITSSTRRVRRTARRAALVVGAGLVTTAALNGAAYAHVEITPGSFEGGEDGVIAFRVPTESDSASTVAVKVLLPRNKPIADVATTPMPGWTATTTTRRLARPIQVEGEKLTSVVSQVTWRATGAGIGPGQYQQFALSLGPLPDSGILVFNAVQTYSDGTVVNWNEVSADKSVEAEHPAPTLTLTAPDSESGKATGSATGSGTASPTKAATTPTTATPADDNGSGST